MWWLIVVGCHSPADGGNPPPTSGECQPVDPEWPAAATTLGQRLVTDPILDTPTELDPVFPDGLAAALDLGLGGYSIGAGEPHLVREDVAAAQPGANQRSLVFFFQQTDAQLADPESPTRVVGLDAPAATESAARPQELYAIHSLDALLRAADDINVDHPIDFAIATGDNADSAQRNETRWFIDTWDGVEVQPDSGVHDSQPDLDCNDPIASFQPVGVDFPWYAVMGNHDVLVQGNFDIAPWADNALGTYDESGTRDLSQPGGPLTTSTIEDPERRLLDRAGLVGEYLETASSPGPIGHGFTAQNQADGTAVWSVHPVDGVPLRLVGLDTNPDGPTDGVLRNSVRDGFLIPELEAATAAGELVVVTSHYSLRALAMEDGGITGDLLDSYPNVILSVVGHSHVNRVSPVPAPGGGGFWEIESSSSVDWPQQGRLIEIVDNANGTLSIFATMLDVLAPDGSMPARSRMLALVDLQTGWRTNDGSGTELDRDVELIVPLPPGVTPTGFRPRVESLTLP